MTCSVRGQVALVTGGASGLGYAFSSILADCPSLPPLD
jgi:NAD(P)-dependent dehydrogenase (short-subunit alcohol dehydrogenase family)